MGLPASALDDPVATELANRVGIEAEPVGQHFAGVLPKQRRRLDGCRDTVEANRPGGHRHLAFAVLHRLQNAAFAEARLVGQFHRVEHGTSGDADRAQLRHRLVFRALPRPTGDNLIDLGLAFQPRVGSIVARIADHRASASVSPCSALSDTDEGISG